MSDEETPPEGGSGTPEGAQQDRTFTQAELDRIVTERVNKSKAQFKDYGDLKKKADEFDRLQAENQTETEKLRTQAEKARKDAEEASQREQAALERANKTLIRAEVVREAALANAADPDDVFKLLDTSALTLSDDGQVSGVKEAVAALLTDKPHLAAQQAAPGFDGGARGGTATASTREDWNDQIRKSAGFG